MGKRITISGASKELGVSVSTLRRWDKSGKLSPEKTASGHRRYDIAVLKPEPFRAISQEERKTMVYARVSGQDQKEDFERQKQVDFFDLFQCIKSLKGG